MASCGPKYEKIIPVRATEADDTYAPYVCKRCRQPVQPKDAASWRHVAPGRTFTGKSKFLPEALKVVEDE